MVYMMGEATPKKVEEAVRQTNIFLRKLLWTSFIEIGYFQLLLIISTICNRNEAS